jgi:hypothetical protein
VKSLVPAFFFACIIGQLAAADFTVTNTDASGPGSLYQAITDANNTAESNRILFSIPGGGVHKIDVSQNPLPPLMRDMVIDGYSQPGAKPNTLSVGDDAVILIQIDGSGSKVPLTGISLSGITSLRVYFPAHYTIRGLSLTGFAAQEPLPAGNCGPDTVKHSYAIEVGTVYSAFIVGNFIGVLPDGETPLPNDRGIRLPQDPHHDPNGIDYTVVGGSDPGSRNVISGHSEYGVTGSGIVQGNYIGTNAKGTKAIANAIGIQTQAGMIIGGTVAGAGNVISGNTIGIQMGDFTYCMGTVGNGPSVGVQIRSNTIGGAGTLPNGSGITIVAGSNNLIDGNSIFYNGSGVIITGGTGSQGNQISHNGIFRNRSLGIDLGGDGVTPNDSNDADSGPNNFQNYPVINSVTISSGTPHSGPFARVTGTLNSTPNSTFRLEFFISSEAGPSGFGQGELYVGSADVTTDASGNASFVAGFETDPGRPVFTATATDSAYNTSEFSPAYPPPARLLNLSTRASVGDGDHVAIAGFIVAGDRLKPGEVPHVLVLRALGPSLTGIQASLPNPTVTLYGPGGVESAKNDNWRDDQAQFIQSLGLAPTNDLESALVGYVGGGGYTAVVRDAGGESGTGLIEVYDVDPNPGRVLNLSTRGYVGTGANVMIGGSIPGPDGRSPVRVLIRAIGPSLAAHGISGPLQDPLLELHDANGNTLIRNDNWREAFNASEIVATGIPPTDDRESAILTVLAPSNSGYTAVVAGANGSTGVALVEVYALN